MWTNYMIQWQIIKSIKMPVLCRTVPKVSGRVLHCDWTVEKHSHHHYHHHYQQQRHQHRDTYKQ